MFKREACTCSGCRSRTDATFWAIVSRLGDVAEVGETHLEVALRERSDLARRIRDHYGITDRPDAHTPEDFSAWLDRIIDNHRRRQGEGA